MDTTPEYGPCRLVFSVIFNVNTLNRMVSDDENVSTTVIPPVVSTTHAIPLLVPALPAYVRKPARQRVICCGYAESVTVYVNQQRIELVAQFQLRMTLKRTTVKLWFRSAMSCIGNFR